MKLTSMTSFVLETIADRSGSSILDYREYAYNRLLKIENYAKFLKQPLTLGMFVSCDEDGNVLCTEKPLSPATDSEWDAWAEYQQAKERCLFERFTFLHPSFLKSDSAYIIVEQKKGILEFKLLKNINDTDCSLKIINTIEDISNCSLQLTPTALKLLEL